MIYLKKTGLATNRENSAEIDVLEIKRFIRLCDGYSREKKGVKNEAKIS